MTMAMAMTMLSIIHRGCTGSHEFIRHSDRPSHHRHRHHRLVVLAGLALLAMLAVLLCDVL
jgi:hypothetical protein